MSQVREAIIRLQRQRSVLLDLPPRMSAPPPPKPFPVKWVIMLGFMIALGSLSLDMYLPALPLMAESFGVETGFIANSVPAYFIGLVVGQLFYGPLSDRIGRRRPLYIGITLFIVATIACIFSPNPYVLFAARVLQALGACVTTVVTRAAIRDSLSPIQSAQAYTLMVLVMGVAPIFAPLVGSVLLFFLDWKGIFWFLCGYGVLMLLLTQFYFKETLAKENRTTSSLTKVFEQYIDLFKDKKFVLPALSGGLLMGALFVYVSSASELLMVGYGLSKLQFSIIFGMNSAGFILMTQINQVMSSKYRLVSILRVGALIQAISALCMVTLGLSFGLDTWLPLVLATIFFCVAGLGLTQPNAVAIALAFQRHRAGLASAMQGSLMFFVGIFGGLMLNLFPVNPVGKLGIVMALLMGLGTLMVWRIDKDLSLDEIE